MAICRGIAITGLLFVLFGCTSSGPNVTISDPAEALAMQRQLRAQDLDFTRVAVARLRLDGAPLEVTSLLPVIVSQYQGTGEPAYTIFRFSAGQERLVLFTRDPANGAAYRLDVSRDQWQDGRIIRFPVLDEDGQIRERKLELTRLIAR